MYARFYKKLIVIGAVFLAVATAFLDLSAQEKNVGKIKLKKTAGKIITDGKIENTEWRGAAEFSLAGGGKILFKRAESFLHVGVRGREKGWCHLYLTEGDGKTVRVLHASAALGAVNYRRPAANDSWQPENTFAWDLRETVFDEKTQTKLDDYLDANGWAANNNNLGGDLEFTIKVERASAANYKFAAVYTSDGKNLQFFPAALTGDALKPELIYGKTPGDLNFQTKSWTRLIFK